MSCLTTPVVIQAGFDNEADLPLTNFSDLMDRKKDWYNESNGGGACA
jgi:hypothetical protein